MIDSGTSIMTLDTQDFSNFANFMMSLDLGCVLSTEIKGLLSCRESNVEAYPSIESKDERPMS